MKKLFLLSLLCNLHLDSAAQAFQFQLYLEDAAGNRDTITLGYDPTATERLDSTFGEADLFGIPGDSLFDVRIVIQVHQDTIYQTKKQIVPETCLPSLFHHVTLEIRSTHWPVTATWDSTLFDHQCREGSVLTSLIPGGWWDVASGNSNLDVVWLREQSQVSFTPNYGYLNCGYIDSLGDTVSLFWMAIGDQSLLHLGIPNTPAQVHAYPNPVQDFLYLDDQTGPIREVRIVNLTGVSEVLDHTQEALDLRNYEPGIYLIIVAGMDGSRRSIRILKE